MKEGRKSIRRKPQTTSFRKCHILKPENSSPNRDSNPHSSIGGRQGKQTCLRLQYGSPRHTGDLKIGTPVAALLGAWRERVSGGSGWVGISRLWLGEVDNLICNVYVAARKLVWADPSPRYTSMLLGHWTGKQATNSFSTPKLCEYLTCWLPCWLRRQTSASRAGE